MTTPTPEYLVQYGRPAFVGRFAAACGPFARGDRVVVRSPRGVELGAVLCEPADRFARLLGPAADGTVLRPADAADLSLADQLAADERAVLAAADRRAAESDVSASFLDAEVFLDRSAAVLHAVAWGDADLTPFLDALSQDLGLTVRLHDTARAPVAADAPEPAGCGKPGCGSAAGGCSSCGTGGGCSTGGCSRGKVKSADELTAYFAGLRAAMDAQAAGSLTPLN